MTQVITQNNCVKVQNTLECKSYFLVFSRVKYIFEQYMKNEETQKPLSNSLFFFFITRVNKYFYCLQIFEELKKLLVNNLKIC
jgi:hypothetical protein